ncbi:PLP-dependent aminotransferase family protein [Sphingosinicella sp. CPCC 101087]|uniref:MocR-like transcription factor YczR n=1 Tax=Sphingosinicella sp. CPCC 101087 TaxID=2497754 RepID=UPI00101C89C9|nr:PLP-dependent aminotransferase family protein [Sphingosinicella sp. CPCC 101087]
MTRRKIGAASLVRLLGQWRLASRGLPAYRQLADALRLLILDGRLGLDMRLPGERQLAEALGLSRTTLSSAFAALREEGFLASRHGAGSVTSLPGRSGAVPPEPPQDGALGRGMIDFSIAALPAGEAVHRAYVDAMSALPAHLPGTGYEPVGLPELRAAVAELYAARGVPTHPDEIMITHGAQHGFALVLRLLTGPGDRVVIDHPTYPLAIDAIGRASCRAVPVALPAQGWDVDALVAALRQTAPRLAYLQPDFHNPTGRCMDAGTRGAVAEAAARAHTSVVVDETMADMWLEAPPPPPLSRFDRAGRVIALGSTGKTFWGGLRVGWIRADAQVIAALARARASLDLGTPVLEQLAVASLLRAPDEPLARRRATLCERRDLVIELARRLMPEWSLPRPEGGLCLWAELPFPCATPLAAAAEACGVRIGAGPRFGIEGAFERFVRLPFTLEPELLESAMERLAAAWRLVREPAGRRSASAEGATRLEPVI